MSREGKYQFGSGRARQSRFRDRAQMEFDDFQIGDFLEPADEELPRSAVPVRFNSPFLTGDPSDSAIAAALPGDVEGWELNNGVDRETDGDVVGELLPSTLFDLMLDEIEREAVCSDERLQELEDDHADGIEQHYGDLIFSYPDHARAESCEPDAVPPTTVAAPVIRTHGTARVASDSAGSKEAFSLRGLAYGLLLGLAAGGTILLVGGLFG